MQSKSPEITFLIRPPPTHRVKLATDLNTQKQVAIKILKVNDLTFSSKEEALLCLQSEVNILY